jgi:prepilin-type N-terminal cleavage/methylation domain-containing protein
MYKGDNMNNKELKGFTLIELLVVVLIIGILAAIALPQYKKTVERAHASDALITLKAITDAEKFYILASGSPTNDFDNLDVNIPGNRLATNKIEGRYFTYDIRNLNAAYTGAFEIVATRNNGGDMGFRNYYIYRHYNGYLVCTAFSAAAVKACESIDTQIKSARLE